MLTFEEASHVYRWKGAPKPSVTQVLDRLHSFAGVPLDVLATAKKRGSMVHLLTQLDDENDLVEDSVESEHAGYLEGWRKFKRDHMPMWTEIEQPFYDETLGVAGTPDRFGSMIYKDARVSAQVDIKTSIAAHPCWGLQTAAYNRIACKKAHRFTCQLRPDGAYKLIPWTDPGDLPVFLSLINLTNWTTRHGIRN